MTSLPIDIISDILYLAELPIDTRLAFGIKPKKLVSPFPESPSEDCSLMRTHSVMDYDACHMKGYRTNAYPEFFRLDRDCSHHQLCDSDRDSWLCHAEYHARYHECVTRNTSQGITGMQRRTNEIYSVLFL